MTPLPLVITASSSTVTYGTTPNVTASYTLPVGGRLVDERSPDLFDHGAIPARPVGSYPSTCTGAPVGADYTISYVPGTAEQITAGADTAHGNRLQFNLPAGNDAAEEKVTYTAGDQLRW